MAVAETLRGQRLFFVMAEQKEQQFRVKPLSAAVKIDVLSQLIVETGTQIAREKIEALGEMLDDEFTHAIGKLLKRKKR